MIDNLGGSPPVAPMGSEVPHYETKSLGALSRSFLSQEMKPVMGKECCISLGCVETSSY